MSTALRLMLLAGSIWTFCYILRSVRESKMRTQDSFFWIVFTVALVILGVFPGVAGALSDLVGVESPANLVFLTVIFLLVVKMLSMDRKISKLQNQVITMTQKNAIDALERETEKEGAGEA